MKIFTITMLIFLSISTIAKTEFGRIIEDVQTRYADVFKKYPILIVDQDEVEYRYAQKNAFGSEKSKESLRVEIFREYVKEKSGVELKATEGLSIEPYTTILKGGAYAVPVNGENKFKHKVCFVFPASANSNQRLETHRILGLDTPGAYENINYPGLQEKLTLEELRLFSLYHELAHCLDPKFMPEARTLYEPDAHSIHESESFAEVLALLLLEREGVRNVAFKRALFRNLFAVKMGKWFAANPNGGFGNPLFKDGGIIYYLTPVLLAGKKLIDEDNSFVFGPIESIIATAIETVTQSALDSRSFYAISQSFHKSEEEALLDYQQKAIEYPQFFKVPYEKLKSFLKSSKSLVSLLEGYRTENSYVLTSFFNKHSTEQFCQALSENNREEFDYLLDKQRRNLIASDQSYGEMKAQKEYLNTLTANLSSCFSH